MFSLYILYSEKHDRYYAGHCEDMNKGLQRRNAGMVPSTRPYLTWEIVYQEAYDTKQEANARERYIKRMKSRKFIEALINHRQA